MSYTYTKVGPWQCAHTLRLQFIGTMVDGSSGSVLFRSVVLIVALVYIPCNLALLPRSSLRLPAASSACMQMHSIMHLPRNFKQFLLNQESYCGHDTIKRTQQEGLELDFLSVRPVGNEVEVGFEDTRIGNLQAGKLNSATLIVDVAGQKRKHPDTLFGIFFEEINNAGVGGLDAELVQNKGFEAGGPNTPSNIHPWTPVGREDQIWLETEHSSCFQRNPIALRMETNCTAEPGVPSSGCLGEVGVINPGYWGMNIEAGTKYLVSLWIRAAMDVDMAVAFRSADNLEVLGFTRIQLNQSEAATWRRVEVAIEALGTDRSGHLALTTTRSGTVWLDQISARPAETFKGHGMRKDLAEDLLALNPGFIRFPGGCYVEGDRLADSFRWRQSVGLKENRPGHFNGVWAYWSDDGLGLYEYLQFAEDINAAAVWVFNSGTSHTDQVDSRALRPFVQDILKGIEFARGPSSSEWGALRAEMGHPEPFDLRYIAIGNENCGAANYKGNYLRFYSAIKAAYPDIQLISNCDATRQPLDHPADLYDFHLYTDTRTMFANAHAFDRLERGGPKAFVSEFAVLGPEAGPSHLGTLLAAVAEAGFLMGVERNSDMVWGASYAPLLVNTNHRQWSPDAVVFDTWRHYGTPSYWAFAMFSQYRGATWLPSEVVSQGAGPSPLVETSASVHHCTIRQSGLLIIKAANLGASPVPLQVHLRRLGEMGSLQPGSNATLITLSSQNPYDENSFSNPTKVVPEARPFWPVADIMSLDLPPVSLSILEVPIHSIKAQAHLRQPSTAYQSID